MTVHGPSGRTSVFVLYIVDGAIVFVATILAYLSRFEGFVSSPFDRYVWPAVLIATVVYLTAFTVAGTYRAVLKFVGVETALRLAGATALGFVLLIGADLIWPGVGALGDLRPVPLGVLFIQAVLVFMGVSGVRLSSRILTHLGTHPFRHASTGRRVLIVGAGSAGSLLLRDIESNPSLGLLPIGFLDDDPGLLGRTIHGIRVLGRTDELARLATRLDVPEVLVALPSADPETLRAVLNSAADAGLTTRIVPSLVLDKSSVSTGDLRKVEVEDLLGREPAAIDVEQVRSTIEGKVVAVTGAAGSIGSELCRQIMRLGPARLILIEIDESRLYELWLELGAERSVAEMHLCDITDESKLTHLIRTTGPDLVLHAAAYKHVPMMELAPEEAVRVNVHGTKVLLDACEAAGVERFVLISTDKAVAPTSVMGATKAVAERLMVESACRDRLNAVAVRFGNVLGSRGSVVPLFEEQLRSGGPVRVTHEDITRYFMTIPEAARLVLQAQAIGKRGEIFVLEMGEPVRIIDLAKKMIALSGIPADIEIVGLRPAEKLHEVLVHADETLVETEAPRILKLAALPPLPIDFDHRVDDLIDTASHDAGSIRGRLKALVPDFDTDAR